MRKRILIGIAIAMLPVTGYSITLEQALQQAREKNPSLQGARSAYEVSRYGAKIAQWWPDPVFSFSDERQPAMDGNPPEKMQHFRLDQEIPFPGKRTLEARMKHHESAIAETAYRDAALEVVMGVRMAYYRLYLSEQKIILARESVDSLAKALRSAQARLAAAKTSASDVFLAQVELRKMENMLFEEQQARRLAEIDLNTFLDQPTDTPWETPTPPPLVALPVSLEDLRTLAERNAPKIQSAVHETRHSEAMQRLARLSYAPDFGLMYDHLRADTGETGRELGLSLRVPLWLGRPQGTYKSATAHVKESQAMARMSRSMTLQMVHKEMVEVETHWTLARNAQNGIIPAALGNLRVSRDAYAGGQLDFLRLLEAVRAWIGANELFQDELYHYAEHWSELERWVGVAIPMNGNTRVKTNSEDSHEKHH